MSTISSRGGGGETETDTLLGPQSRTHTRFHFPTDAAAASGECRKQSPPQNRAERTNEQILNQISPSIPRFASPKEGRTDRVTTYDCYERAKVMRHSGMFVVSGRRVLVVREQCALSESNSMSF